MKGHCNHIFLCLKYLTNGVLLNVIFNWRIEESAKILTNGFLKCNLQLENWRKRQNSPIPGPYNWKAIVALHMFIFMYFEYCNIFIVITPITLCDQLHFQSRSYIVLSVADMCHKGCTYVLCVNAYTNIGKTENLQLKWTKLESIFWYLPQTWAFWKDYFSKDYKY